MENLSQSQFENYMVSEFAKMNGKSYLETQEEKELKNIFSDPYIQAEKNFIFDLLEGFNQDSVFNNKQLVYNKNFTKTRILKLEASLHSLMNDVENVALNNLRKSSLSQKDKEVFSKIISKELNQSEKRFFGALNSHISVSQIFYSYDFNQVLKIDKSFSRPKSSCFKGQEKIINFCNEIKISRSNFESFGLKVPETLEEFAKANQGPKILTRKMINENPSLKRSICYLNIQQLNKALINIKSCNCTKIFLKDLRKSITHEYIGQQSGYEKTDFKDINLVILRADPIRVSHTGYNSMYDNDNLRNLINISNSKQSLCIKNKKKEFTNTLFYNNHVCSKKDIIFINREKLIAKYNDQKAEKLIKKDKINVLPLSRKLVYQTKIADQNLKIVPGPHPFFTFGELALIGFINTLYYFNKFLKKLGFKGFFFN